MRRKHKIFRGGVYHTLAVLLGKDIRFELLMGKSLLTNKEKKCLSEILDYLLEGAKP